MIEITMNSPSRRHLSSSPFPPPVEVDHPTYALGERVCHDTFGLGRVIGLEGSIAVSVDFGSFTRRVTLPTPRLFSL
ncbi:MAG: hypothetical protein ACJ71Z_07595 [Aeromicrobium sp.]